MDVNVSSGEVIASVDVYKPSGKDVSCGCEESFVGFEFVKSIYNALKTGEIELDEEIIKERS